MAQDFMIGIMNENQLSQVEDMLSNRYPEDRVKMSLRKS